MHTGTSSGVYTQTTEVGNVTAAAVSNLTTGKTYYFVVTAYNKGLVDGPPSNEVSFVAGSSPTPTPTPSATPTAAPTPIAPTNLAAAAASSSQINLSWVDRANNETGFKIERSKDGTTFSQISTVGANTIAYNSSGLVASTKYYYRVRAYNSSGSSPYSNVSSATTMAASSPTPTPTPTPTPSVTPTATPTPSATVDTPTISPASGTFKKRVTIRFSCTTAGATIYYTLDGSNPTTASAAYFVGKRKSKGIRIVGVGSHTVKAKAAMNGYNDSAIATANLTLY